MLNKNLKIEFFNLTWQGPYFTTHRSFIFFYSIQQNRQEAEASHNDVQEQVSEKEDTGKF